MTEVVQPNPRAFFEALKPIETDRPVDTILRVSGTLAQKQLFPNPVINDLFEIFQLELKQGNLPVTVVDSAEQNEPVMFMTFDTETGEDQFSYDGDGSKIYVNDTISEIIEQNLPLLLTNITMAAAEYSGLNMRRLGRELSDKDITLGSQLAVLKMIKTLEELARNAPDMCDIKRLEDIKADYTNTVNLAKALGRQQR
jgi:hypothetical protein